MYGATELEFPMSKEPSNSAAVAAFIARKSEIDAILARLAALSAQGHSIQDSRC
jgi:hypothetical protein